MIQKSLFFVEPIADLSNTPASFLLTFTALINKKKLIVYHMETYVSP
jgi:hypothetical protein